MALYDRYSLAQEMPRLRIPLRRGRYAEVYDDSGQITFTIKMIPSPSQPRQSGMEYLRDGVPNLQDLLSGHLVPGRSMLDLACGTGTVAFSFAQQGWEVYGVDGSAGMLEQARRKAQDMEGPVALSQQDMRHFVLSHPVGLVNCLYDSLNYVLTLADLRQAFRRVRAALVPGGLFLGDLTRRLRWSRSGATTPSMSRAPRWP